MRVATVLASDIDNTLTGDASALRRLCEAIDALRSRQALVLFLSTGRRMEQVVAGLSAEGVPQADAVISHVGTEIFLPPYAAAAAPLPEWTDRVSRGFDRGAALELLAGIHGLVMQPDMYNTTLKVSCFMDGVSQPEAAVALIRKRAARRGGYQVVWSSGRDLDVIPAAAGKGNAIRFLIDHLSLRPDRVIVAGDSGNDASMFDAYPFGIVVGNAQPELLAHVAARRHDGVYLAAGRHAAGVTEGLRHFGVL